MRCSGSTVSVSFIFLTVTLRVDIILSLSGLKLWQYRGKKLLKTLKHNVSHMRYKLKFFYCYLGEI
jgi:hypothetical protein